MNPIATLRQRQIPWARRALGLFVVVWVNIALQPCAMAMGADDDPDCPHCPPSPTRQHDRHDMSSAAMTDLGMPCATGATDCNVLDEVNIDTRTGQIKLKDSPSELPVAQIPPEPWLASMQIDRVSVVVLKVDFPPGFSPPLNVLYCVYLD